MHEVNNFSYENLKDIKKKSKGSAMDTIGLLHLSSRYPLGGRKQRRWLNDRMHKITVKDVTEKTIAHTTMLEDIMEHLTLEVTYHSTFEELMKPENEKEMIKFIETKEEKEVISNKGKSIMNSNERYMMIPKEKRQVLQYSYVEYSRFIHQIEIIIKYFIEKSNINVSNYLPSCIQSIWIEKGASFNEAMMKKNEEKEQKNDQKDDDEDKNKRQDHKFLCLAMENLYIESVLILAVAGYYLCPVRYTSEGKNKKIYIKQTCQPCPTKLITEHMHVHENVQRLRQRTSSISSQASLSSHFSFDDAIHDDTDIDITDNEDGYQYIEVS